VTFPSLTSYVAPDAVVKIYDCHCSKKGRYGFNARIARYSLKEILPD